MLGLTLVVALICGYLTLGLLFYLGSWQLALRPTHNAGAGTGLSTKRVQMGSGNSATPLPGEWLPANTATGRGTYAVLYLRGADGQLDTADATQIAMLHDLGLNVLAFDYRGYGATPPQPHPTEKRMLQDAATAWTYLLQKQNIAPDHILVFGSGVGVSIGSQLLEQRGTAAALIGYNADPEVMARVGRDPRSKLFPLRLVFHERFPLDALERINVPKLLYTIGPLDAARDKVYKAAADPKLTVEVPSHNAQQERNALARFVDETLPATPSALTPLR